MVLDLAGDQSPWTWMTQPLIYGIDTGKSIEVGRVLTSSFEAGKALSRTTADLMALVNSCNDPRTLPGFRCKRLAAETQLALQETVDKWLVPPQETALKVVISSPVEGMGIQ